MIDFQRPCRSTRARPPGPLKSGEYSLLISNQSSSVRPVVMLHAAQGPLLARGALGFAVHTVRSRSQAPFERGARTIFRQQLDEFRAPLVSADSIL